MAYIKQPQDCDCATCSGGQSAPPGVFGGWKCMCPCHQKPPPADKEAKGTLPRYHNPDNLPSAGEPPWRFLVKGEEVQEGDGRWNKSFGGWDIVLIHLLSDEDVANRTFRTRRPLSTQPKEGGEECAQNSASIADAPTLSTMTTVHSCASNAAGEESNPPVEPQFTSYFSRRPENVQPANVPTVAGGGKEEAEWVTCGYCGGTGILDGSQCPKCHGRNGRWIKHPSPPSTAGENVQPVSAPQADKPREGETPRVDELAPQWARNGITGLRQAIAFARDLERQLAEANTKRKETAKDFEIAFRLVRKENEQHQATIATLRARLAALEAGQGWRPIETAPKDGTNVLMYRDGNVKQAHWLADEQAWGSRRHGWKFSAWDGPTHWMPIPPPPAPAPSPSSTP